MSADAVIATAPFETARACLLSLLLAGEHLVVLVGEPGTGKSLLLRVLGDALRAEGCRVRRYDLGDQAERDVDADILLIDEARRLPPVLLPDLLGGGRSVLLSLLPGDLDRLALPRRPAVVTLDRLSPTEARSFLDLHLRRSGREIVAGARSSILYAAEGLPGRLALLAGAAAMEAALDGAGAVGMRHARRAVDMHRLGDPLPADPLEEEPAGPVPVRGPTAIETPPTAVAPIDSEVATPASVVRAEPVAEPHRDPAPQDRESSRRLLVVAAAAALLLAGGGLGAALVSTGPFERASRTEPSVAEPQPGPARPVSPAPPKAAAPPAAVPAPAARAEPTPPVELPKAPVQEAAQVEQTAPAPPPPEPVVEPAPPPVVTIEYSRAVPGAADAADRIAAVLRARGLEVGGTRGVAGPIRSAETRHAAGGEEAARPVQRALDEAFRAYGASAPGRIVEAKGAGDGIVVRVPDTAATLARPLRMDAPPPR